MPRTKSEADMKNLIHAFLILCIAIASRASAAVVTVADNTNEFVLSNGIVTAHIEKSTSDLLSLNYNSTEILGNGPGRTNGYWSLPGTTMNFGSDCIASIITDPKDNNGQRAVISIKFTYDKRPNTVPADVE